MSYRLPLLVLASFLVFTPLASYADDFYGKNAKGEWVKVDEGAQGARQLTPEEIKLVTVDPTATLPGTNGDGGHIHGGAGGKIRKGVTVTDGGDIGKERMQQSLGADGLGSGIATGLSQAITDPNAITTTGDGVVKAQHDHSRPGGGMSTTDSVEEELLLNRLRELAQASANAPANREYRAVIMATYAQVARDILADPERKYGADQTEVFGPMLELQLAQQLALRDLNGRRRRGELKPGDYERERGAIEQKTADGMGNIPAGIVMDSFHSNFDKVWRANRPGWHRPDDAAGALPPRGHIGGMLDADPKNPSTLTLSAQDKLAGGDRAGGRAALDAAIANGGTADAYAIRGGLRLEEKDFDGAYLDAKKALALNPGDKDAMGVLKSAEGRTSPGLAASLAAGGGGSSGSGGSGAAANGGAGYGGGFASGGFDSGRGRDIPGMTSASALASSQKLDEARRALAMGDLQSAISLAQRALELNPGNAAAHNLLSFVYSRQRDYPRAIASASAGLGLDPRNPALLNNKAYAQNHAKKYRDALESSNHALEADPRNAYSYANRAYAYGGLGDKPSMLSDIEQAAALDPSFKAAAAEAAELQLPSNADILFMFPGEDQAAPAAAPERSRSFGLVVGAGIVGGLLLALGLLSTVLAPLKDSVVSAFTKATRRGPSVHALEEESTPEAAPAAGAAGLIRGQYEIVRQIGAGGMGMVYEGTDRSLGRRVAIKKMRDELRINPRERERFVIEAKTVASLRHPNIVDIYAIAEEGDDVYLVFEYVDGKTIHDLVQSQGRLNRADAVRVTSAMGEALTYAHAHGVIHRDMKPSNVMLTGDGRIKVMDFGIARMAKDALTRYSMTNTVVGTPPYMAPEQEQGVVRKESDVYSLAVCSYEMLTGKMPFIGIAAGMLMNKINMSYIPPSRAIAGLPDALDEVFLKAFQADPDHRYRAPQEFSAALESAFGGVRASTKPV
jgi:tetratricopeptide (TPR) repeat protein